ncbi:DUF1488 family protein [Brucella cytisi]
MSLSFPNPSKSFDDFDVGVCFVGYDAMTSVLFLIDKTALQRQNYRFLLSSTSLGI